MSTRFTLSRRALLLGAIGSGLLAGCNLLPGQGNGTLPAIPDNLPLAKKNFTVAISPGTQTLWRYVAANNDKLLKPLGYEVNFVNVTSPDELEQAFTSNADTYDAIVVPATLVPKLAEEKLEAQFFLPIAWIRQGYVLAVKKDAAIQSVADVRGKAVVGPDPNDPAFVYWPALTIKNYGFNLVNDTTYSPLPDLASMVQQLNTGQAEVMALSGTSWAQLANEPNYRLLSDLKQEWDKASSQPQDSTRLLLLGGYVARNAFIQANQRFVEDLIRVHYTALQRYHDKTEKPKMLADIANYNQNGAPQIDAGIAEYLSWYLGMEDAAPQRVYLTADDVRDCRLLYDLLKNSSYISAVPSSVDTLFYQSRFHPA